MKPLLIQVCILAFGVSSYAGSLPEGAANVAFVSIRTGDAHIYVQDRKGTDHMLTNGVGVHTQPALSVDGRVAYVLQVKGVPTIYTMKEDGSNHRRLTQSDRGESAPSWSPDGKSLAYFSMAMDTGTQELHILDLERANTVKIMGPGKDMGPTPASWSADGTRLAFLAVDAKGKSQVFVTDREGSAVRDISSKFAPRGGGYASLSPDGRSVAWVADLRGRYPIVVTDVETGAFRDLTEGQAAGHEAPRWSPNGRQLVFVSARGGQMDPRSEIYVMDADGKNVRNVSNHPLEDFDPKWSADGRNIVFASLRNGTTQMFEVSLESGVTRQLSTSSSHDMDHVVRPVAAVQ